MTRTAERLVPDEVTSRTDAAVDVRHRFAYALVPRYAAAGARLLDVGCGVGYGAAIVAGAVGEYVGVDVAPDAIAYAHARYAGPQARFATFDGRRLPFADAAFGVVTSFQVIEHVADVEAFLAELERVARAGAPILITTPNRLLRLRPGERPWNRHHLREYDAAGLRDALRRFERVEIAGICGSEALERVELARLHRARRIARLDHLGLRHALPDVIDRPVRALLRGRGGGPAAAAFTLADVRLDPACPDGALDLLAVAYAGSGLRASAT
jgi:SAM-dependent methyltransferase